MATVSPEFESILKKYEKQKINTYKVLELLGTNYVFNNYGADDTNDLYTQILNCGTQLFFNKEITNGNTVYHLKNANFCRNRICPMCQFRRSEKIFAQMFYIVQQLEPEYRFIHLVLTIPNVSGGIALQDAIGRLYKGFSRFYSYKQIKRAFNGCLRCLEISYNYDDDSFHPHLHCLVAVKKSYFNDSKIYLSYDRLRKLWSKACKSDTLLQIFVRACKAGDYEGVAEVCKYSLKPLDFGDKGKESQNINILLTLAVTLKGKRFLQKYGIIKEKFAEFFGDNDDITEDDEISSSGNIQEKYIYWDDIDMKYKGE